MFSVSQKRTFKGLNLRDIYKPCLPTFRLAKQMPKKKNASWIISELKRKTRRNDSSEEKIRRVIEGIRDEMTIAELCLIDLMNIEFHKIVIF